MGLAVSLPNNMMAIQAERIGTTLRLHQQNIWVRIDFVKEPQMTAIVSFLIFGCPVFFGDLFLDGTCLGEKEMFATQQFDDRQDKANPLLKFSARFQRCKSQTFTEM